MSITRRHLLQVFAGSLAAAACKRKLPDRCQVIADLPTDDAKLRSTLGYQEQTPFPDKTCETCTQYVQPSVKDGCGSCKLMKGSVHPLGYCKSFALKT
jgi:hypothetical protein